MNITKGSTMKERLKNMLRWRFWLMPIIGSTVVATMAGHWPHAIWTAGVAYAIGWFARCLDQVIDPPTLKMDEDLTRGFLNALKTEGYLAFHEGRHTVDGVDVKQDRDVWIASRARTRHVIRKAEF